MPPLSSRTACAGRARSPSESAFPSCKPGLALAGRPAEHPTRPRPRRPVRPGRKGRDRPGPKRTQCAGALRHACGGSSARHPIDGRDWEPNDGGAGMGEAGPGAACARVRGLAKGWVRPCRGPLDPPRGGSAVGSAGPALARGVGPTLRARTPHSSTQAHPYPRRTSSC
jgi:hypothetical protein